MLITGGVGSEPRADPSCKSCATGTYSGLTPPLLRQAAWSQLRPVYDQPAPGAGGADIRWGSTVVEEKAEAASAPTAPPGMGGLTSTMDIEPGASDRQATSSTERCADGGNRSTSSDSDSISEPEGGWAAKWAEEALGPTDRDSTRHAGRLTLLLASESRRYRDAHDGGGGGGGGHGGGWAKPCWFAACGAARAGGDCGGSGCGCWCWDGVDDGRGAADSGRAQAAVEGSAALSAAGAVEANAYATTAAVHTATLMDADAVATVAHGSAAAASKPSPSAGVCAVARGR